MKVNVDFSVFTKSSGAFGQVSGEVYLTMVPNSGDLLSFVASGKHDVFVHGFTGLLDVTSRVIAVNREDQQLALGLRDVVMPTEDDALRLMKYFESEYGMFSEVYTE